MSKPLPTPREMAARIVTHVTEVKISLRPDGGPLGENQLLTPPLIEEAGVRLAEHYARVAAMMSLLEQHGFAFRSGKGAVRCFSNEVEAGEAKRLLLSAGFRDREFQIVLEYTRGWGML